MKHISKIVAFLEDKAEKLDIVETQIEIMRDRGVSQETETALFKLLEIINEEQ